METLDLELKVEWRCYPYSETVHAYIGSGSLCGRTYNSPGEAEAEPEWGRQYVCAECAQRKMVIVAALHLNGWMQDLFDGQVSIGNRLYDLLEKLSPPVPSAPEPVALKAKGKSKKAVEPDEAEISWTDGIRAAIGADVSDLPKPEPSAESEVPGDEPTEAPF